MVKDAEKYKDEDEEHKTCIDAKNNLEGYTYSIRNTINEEKINQNLSSDDKQKIEDKIKECQNWIDQGGLKKKHEYEMKL